MPSFSRISAARMPSQRRRELDEDALLLDAGALVHRDERAGLLDARLRVVGEARVDLGRDAAGDDLEDLEAELDGEAIDGALHDVLGAAALRLLA